MVKRSLYPAIILAVIIGPVVFGGQNCDFDITGDWKAAGDGVAAPLFVSFDADGTVAIRKSLERKGQVLATGTYKLDYPKSPKAIQFIGTKAMAFLSQGTTSLAIKVKNDSSFTSTGAKGESIRWVRAESSRQFLVFAAREGDRSFGGPAFAMLIKKEGKQTQIEAAGLYFEDDDKNFGAIPQKLYREFLTQPKSDTDVMLRLEITRGEYERGLKIVREWERRAREGALLYAPADPRGLYLDTSILLKQVAESVNQCEKKINLYDLNWRSDDEVVVNNSATHVPYQYLRRLQELNKKSHVTDREFSGPTRIATTVISQ